MREETQAEAYIFANKNIYFMKIWNTYYCYHDVYRLATEIRRSEVKNVVTEKMPDGITESEGGMRLLENKEIRELKDILEDINEK